MRGAARIAELCLLGHRRSARIVCEAGAIPAPGRYILAHDPLTNAPLATELFASALHADGFTAAPPVPRDWFPGSTLNFRGPLGTGFEIPAQAARIGLVAFETDVFRLLPLAHMALGRGQAVAVVCQDPPMDLPLHVEVHPLEALSEVLKWANYLAMDVERASLGSLVNRLSEDGGRSAPRGAQVLVRTPMPCGGMAECGVCSVETTAGAELACVNGPVFELSRLRAGF